MAIQQSIHQVQWPALVLIAAGIVLAIHPALWLVNSWLEPAYISNGLAVFLLVAGLFVWSVTSRAEAETNRKQKNLAIGLLLLSALMTWPIWTPPSAQCQPRSTGQSRRMAASTALM